MINYCDNGAYFGSLFGLTTTQNVLHVGYFWPSIFKDCIEVVKKCHPYQAYTWKMCLHPALIFPIITIGPFTK